MNSTGILTMNRNELLRLYFGNISRFLSWEEIRHILTELNCYWEYNWGLADEVPGYHAELKGGLHSDCFLNLKDALKHKNIRMMFASQLKMKMREMIGYPRFLRSSFICGIPTAATELGRDLATLMGTRFLEMEKNGAGEIVISEETEMPMSGESVIIVEDLCTRGTGVSEAIREIKSRIPGVHVMKSILYIVNRGILDVVAVNGVGTFEIVPLAAKKINEWEPDLCPLCTVFFSGAIKPKNSPSSWRKLINSQKLTKKELQ